MAGGKETPRQKMIGMMYLVLTALLALNVSKSILDAFVAIEENTQKSNIAQLDRGNGFKGDVTSEISTTKGPDNALKLKKLKKILAQMEEVDKITATMIQDIDKIKIEILKESGEDMAKMKPNDEETIMWAKGDGCKPARMHLMAVQAKDQYDIPMHYIVGEDIKTPTGEGKKLWADFNDYRAKLVQVVGSYDAYSIKPAAINDFKDNNDLALKVDKMILSSKANIKRDEKGKVLDLGEDGQVLKDIYINLTKPERVKQHDLEGVHWIGATFDHSPLVAAVASLSSMQQDILSARAMALAHLKSKVSTGEYSFNKIVGLAYGPAIATANEEVEVKVMMAAFDSDNQPTVTYGGGTFQGTDGQYIIKTKAGSGDMNLTGTVSIKNKAGVAKTENWTHTIKVMKPQGTVSLPEMNMLYRGYNNVIEGVASGYDETVLSGSGVTLSKTGTQYIGRVTGTGREASISISGRNNVTKKTQQLGVFKFRVSNLPPPSLYLGTLSSGSTAGASAVKAMSALFMKYPPEIPLKASFEVGTWEVSVSGAPRTVQGSGKSLSPEALNLIKQAKPGNTVSISGKFKGPNSGFAACVIKVQ
ncbi:MAG: GldM family protein [Fluviicola sp.]|nr:GldM family protein [Fluviicola sp.]